jgi:hypothetical protein
MAQSRFCLKSYGVLQLNNQILTTDTTGTLLVNDVNVDINQITGYTGGSGGLSFTSFNDEPENNLGGQFIVLNDSTGNVVTNTYGLNTFTDKGIITGLQAHNGNNYINFRSIGDLGITSNSSGISLSAPDRIQIESLDYCTISGTNLISLASNNTLLRIDGDYDYVLLTTADFRYNASKISVNNSAVTDQTDSITTSVNSNLPFGHIITISATTATQGSSTFNVTSSIVTVDSLIQLSINRYTGTQGLPNAYVSNITTGNFTINISNHSITDPLNGTLKLAYSIMN